MSNETDTPFKGGSIIGSLLGALLGQAAGDAIARRYEEGRDSCDDDDDADDDDDDEGDHDLPLPRTPEQHATQVSVALVEWRQANVDRFDCLTRLMETAEEVRDDLPLYISLLVVIETAALGRHKGHRARRWTGDKAPALVSLRPTDVFARLVLRHNWPTGAAASVYHELCEELGEDALAVKAAGNRAAEGGES